jgi:hypothetical protein
LIDVVKDSGEVAMPR